MKKAGRIHCWLLAAGCTLAVGLLLAVPPAGAQDTSCDPGELCGPPQVRAVCDAGGFRIKLVGFEDPATSTSGAATYTYEFCSPPAGTCNGTVRFGESCLDNAFCRRKGQDTDPTAKCSRDCAVNSFQGLSHSNVYFPELGNSCLGEDTQVTGTCECIKVQGSLCDVDPDIVLGDGQGSCNAPDTKVAKCDNVEDMAPGDCIKMTLKIAGELTDLGLGAAVVESKESQDCNETCIVGPACDDDRCDPDVDDGECLTRTRGFWGTHPHIAGKYTPVTVCGVPLTTTTAGVCSTSEALCTSAADRPSNTPYLALVAQLTAAKLNLKATAALFPGAACGSFTYQDTTIQSWIATCETFCDKSKQAISNSGCIEALDAFNNSQDTGFDVTPSPFDAPGPAKPAECQAARGNGTYVGTGNKNACSQPLSSAATRKRRKG